MAICATSLSNYQSYQDGDQVEVSAQQRPVALGAERGVCGGRSARLHHGFNAGIEAAIVPGIEAAQRDFCIVMMTIGESPDVRL